MLNETFSVIFKHCAFISNFVDIFPRDNLSNSHALSLSISDMYLAQVHFGMQFLHFYISWQKRFCFRFSKENFLSFFIVANKRRGVEVKNVIPLCEQCAKNRLTTTLRLVSAILSKYSQSITDWRALHFLLICIAAFQWFLSQICKGIYYPATKYI